MFVGLFATGTAAAVASCMLTPAEEWTLFFLLFSLCSGWTQPLLGTLVALTLQLPCERKVVKGKKKRRREGRMGGQKRGRDESKQHQRDNVTFLRAQGLLIRGSFAQGAEREASREGRRRKRPTGLLYSRKDRGHQTLRG